MEGRYRKYFAVMVLCFLVGGFSIILYSIQAYSAFVGLEVFGSFTDFRSHIPNGSSRRHYQNESFGGFDTDISNGSFGGRFIPFNPARFITSPFSLMLLFVGIVSIISGISIFNLVREKEIRLTKENLTSILLSPEEKLVVDEIKNTNGEIIQSQLVKKTGLSKVRIHRALTKLESKGIVKKYRYGLSNKIILEKDI